MFVVHMLGAPMVIMLCLIMVMRLQLIFLFM